MQRLKSVLFCVARWCQMVPDDVLCRCVEKLNFRERRDHKDVRSEQLRNFRRLLEVVKVQNTRHYVPYLLRPFTRCSDVPARAIV